MNGDNGNPGMTSGLATKLLAGTKTTPTERRLDAVQTLVKTFLNESNGYTIADTSENRTAYADMVTEMIALGRTSRWIENCKTAALCATETNEDDHYYVNDLGWVIRQYGIYLGYAA
jgi:hypothetical protein